MNAERLEQLITTGIFGVHFFYCKGIASDFNDFFAAMPVRGCVYGYNTVQWHRDILPSLNRWVKARTGKTLMKVVTHNDGLTETMAVSMLHKRVAGKNDCIWLAFEWESYLQIGKSCFKKGRSCFKEVEFPPKELSHFLREQLIEVTNDD